MIMTLHTVATTQVGVYSRVSEGASAAIAGSSYRSHHHHHYYLPLSHCLKAEILLGKEEERRLISSTRRKESLVSGRNKGKRRSVRQRGRVSLVLRMGYRQRSLFPPLLPWRRRGGGSWRDGSWNG